MSVRVIEPPEPIVTPGDIPGVDGDDDMVAAMIAAVTANIDGPDGWLGRALGPQLLELRTDCWSNKRIRLPYPPIIEVESVSYVDSSTTVQTVDPENWYRDGAWLLFKPSWNAPSLGDVPEPVIVEYRAGYNGEPVSTGGTGDIPTQVTQAIILMVRHLRSISVDNLFVRAEEVDGVGRIEYTVSDQAGNIIQQTSERLLGGLRVYL